MPSRFNDHQKMRFPTQSSAIVARLNEEHERVLYVQASTLRAIDRITKLPSILIVDGLYSGITFYNGEHIADGEYMLHVNATTRMDCYSNCMNIRCITLELR